MQKTPSSLSTCRLVRITDQSTEHLEEAVRTFQQTGANALKVEGSGRVIDVIRLLTETGIPVVAHLGLLPQSAAVVGGYKVQGKTAEAAQQLIEDARACQEAGCVYGCTGMYSISAC